MFANLPSMFSEGSRRRRALFDLRRRYRVEEVCIRTALEQAERQLDAAQRAWIYEASSAQFASPAAPATFGGMRDEVEQLERDLANLRNALLGIDEELRGLQPH